jgi:hypothetical protein
MPEKFIETVWHSGIWDLASVRSCVSTKGHLMHGGRLPLERHPTDDVERPRRTG